MKKSHKNTDYIISYLSYLRDISRKIVSRNGFEKCFLNKSYGYASQIKSIKLELSVSEKSENYLKIRRYFDIINTNNDKKLFIGFGIITGTDKRTLAGPLIYMQCDLILENESIVKIIPDLETISLNYDIISILSSEFIDNEDDFLSFLNTEGNKLIEDIEERIRKIRTFNYTEIQELSNKSFNELKEKINGLSSVKSFDNENYDFNIELQKYFQRPIGKSISKKLNREKSVFETELKFINSNHFFINLIPDELSTFEALNTFVKNLEQENDFKNPVLEKLLINALTDKSIEIKHENRNDELQKIIDEFLPILISNCQIQGLKNAWTNEISYIQGPPGTGKSHTISAITLSAIELNKKVLVLSQKTAALKVVNDKINPLLVDDEGMIGICYYDPTARKKIKEYLSFLRLKTNNKSDFLREKLIINNQIRDIESELKIEFENLNQESEKLTNMLDKQRVLHEINSSFLSDLEFINESYYQIPNKFKFKKIKDIKKYHLALKNLEFIYSENINKLSTKLFIHKFKNHLKEKFDLSDQHLSENKLLNFSKSFINLNNKYTLIQEKTREISLDTISIRKEINRIKTKIFGLKKSLTKLKFKKNLYQKIEDSGYQKEIDKFSGMLTNVNSRLIDKRMKDIDFNKVLDIIPFWTAEIRNLGKLFPLQHDMFDLVIVDEASQVNLAEIIPAFYRAKKICIVGDHNQLSLKASGLNFSLGKKFDELTWQKYNSTILDYKNAEENNLIVTKSSILDFINCQNNTFLPQIMLDEHFRSLPKLANYTGNNYYNDGNSNESMLKIMTETPDKLTLECFQAVKVDGFRDTGINSKVILVEAEEVVKIIEDLTAYKQDLFYTLEKKYTLPSHIEKSDFTIGVISMIRDQCSKISELIDERLPNLDSSYELMIGTPEEFQGNERDIIIFSLCLDKNCKGGQSHFQDSKRLNVATSRAKSFTYFVYSEFPNTFEKIHKYLNYINGNANLDNLTNENIDIANNYLPILDFSKFDSDFERYVYSYLVDFINNINDHNNKITIHNQVKSCGQKRLDFVLYNNHTKKSVAIEVDGVHHFVNNGIKQNYSKQHLERIDVLTRAGWKIINTPYHKWYKDGWLNETINKDFKDEIDRIYSEIKKSIF